MTLRNRNNILHVASMRVATSLGLRFTLDYSYTSDQQADFLADPVFDAYSLWGLHLLLHPQSEKWEIAVFGRNLTEEYYWTSVQMQTDTTFRYTGLPSTWGASFSDSTSEPASNAVRKTATRWNSNEGYPCY